MIEFSLLIIGPLLTAVFCWLIKNLRMQYAVSLLISIIHVSISITIFTGLIFPVIPYFFCIDSLSKLILLVLSNVYFWVTIVSYSFLKRPSSPKAQSGKKYYFALLNFYLFANTAAIVSNQFGIYWVAAEATTLSVAPLVYYYRNEEALEAMWKYLFLVSVGIAFAFIGILFLALSAKGTILEGKPLIYSNFVKNALQLNPVWLKASFIFIFVGLSTKIGIAPMHSADIDATSNSPSPIAALMSGSLRVTALLGVLRIFQIIHKTSASEFARMILIIGGLLSISLACISMFKVKNFKRLLAYSSVEHLGIIVLGIGVGGIAFVGAMYHIIYNSIIKVVLFFSAGNIHQKYQTREAKNVHGVLTILPITGWIFLLSFLAISAIPPSGIFFSELMIFEGMLYSHNPWILAIVMVLMLSIFITMGHILFTMLYTKYTGEISTQDKERFSIIHFASITLLLILSAIALISPDILRTNILNIANDFGIQL